MAAETKTVWLLGSGFSKPLHGPLLRDLFRQEREADVLPFFPEGAFPDLARSLPWVQLCFQDGHREGLWENAEQFLAYVDDAYRGSIAKKRRVTNVISQCQPPPRPGNTYSPDEEEKIVRAYRDSVIESLDRRVKRALAAECSRFLIDSNLTSELWLPYREWVKSLQPGTDTVVTFNYDRVIEMAAEAVSESGKMWIGMPGQTQPARTVPVLKLHGSVDWQIVQRPDGEKVDPKPDVGILRSPYAIIAIAAPGGSKNEFVTTHLGDLWDMAATALTEATRLMIVGYGFPDTDNYACYRLLNAFESGTPLIRWVHVVLGAEATPVSRRMLSLVGSTVGFRRTFFSEAPNSEGNGQNIVHHPLGTQDFIGRHGNFTAPRRQ